MLVDGFRRIKRAFYRFRNRLPRLSSRYTYKSDIGWLRDRSWMEPFAKYLQRDGRGGTRKLDRRFMILQLAQAVRHLPGSTAECGVGKGGGSAMICKALEGTYHDGACHYAFDSFQGLPAPAEVDRMKSGKQHWFEGKLSNDYDTVRAVLADFTHCRVVKGWIPESLVAADGHQFRFVHIDVDLHSSTWDSLDYFYDRMVEGGVILFDDHGFINCPGARKAACDFFADKPDRIIELTTGQAFVILGPRRRLDAHLGGEAAQQLDERNCSPAGPHIAARRDAAVEKRNSSNDQEMAGRQLQ